MHRRRNPSQQETVQRFRARGLLSRRGKGKGKMKKWGLERELNRSKPGSPAAKGSLWARELKKATGAPLTNGEQLVHDVSGCLK